VWHSAAQDTSADAAYQEALRRIETVRVSGSTILDLYNLGLVVVPAEIGQLEDLTTLVLSDNPIKEFPAEVLQLKKLNYLALDSTEINVLPSEIGQLVNLRYFVTAQPSKSGNRVPTEV
jgi:Leucine-rich repeat (LRR) protein